MLADYGAHEKCLDRIAKAKDVISKSSVDSNVQAFNVCGPLKTYSFSDLFVYALESLPQLDYPYAVGPLSAWPVKAACTDLLAARDDDMLQKAAGNISQRALNNGAKECMEPLLEGPAGVPGDGPGGIDSWSWQSCTENLHQFSARGIRTYVFNMEKDAVDPCKALFNGSAVLNTSKLTYLYGGYKLPERVTNIIFSNGLLDPWHGGGLLLPKNKADSPLHTHHGNGVHSIFMKLGAHHLDLRGPHKQDPDEITRARQIELEIIKGFIDDAAALKQ